MATIDMDNLVRDNTKDNFSMYRNQKNSNPTESEDRSEGDAEGGAALRSTVESVISGFLSPFDDENTKTSDMKIAQSINKSILFEVEAGMYEAVMHYCKGNQSKAAKVLGVITRHASNQIKIILRHNTRWTYLVFDLIPARLSAGILH